MRIYRLEYELEDGEFCTMHTTNEDEAISEMEDTKKSPNCIYAKLTELYCYGGICQGEKVIEEYINA